MVEERFLDAKIDYGKASYTLLNPDGESVSLNLAGNYDTPMKHGSQDKSDMQDTVMEDAPVPVSDSNMNKLESPDTPEGNQYATVDSKGSAYKSKGVSARSYGAGSSAGLIHSDLRNGPSA